MSPLKRNGHETCAQSLLGTAENYGLVSVCFLATSKFRLIQITFLIARDHEAIKKISTVATALPPREQEQCWTHLAPARWRPLRPRGVGASFSKEQSLETQGNRRRTYQILRRDNPGVSRQLVFCNAKSKFHTKYIVMTATIKRSTSSL